MQHCSVLLSVSVFVSKKKREGEIEDRGKGCRETASSVVGGRDWRERASEGERESQREIKREEGCWG